MLRTKWLLVATLLIALCVCGMGCDGDDGDSIVGPSPIVPDLSGTWDISVYYTAIGYSAAAPDVGITFSGSETGQLTISQTGDFAIYTAVSYSSIVSEETFYTSIGFSGSGKVSGSNGSVITQDSYQYSVGNCVVEGTRQTSGTLSGNTWSFTYTATETTNNASDCSGIGSATARGSTTAIRQ